MMTEQQLQEIEARCEAWGKVEEYPVMECGECYAGGLADSVPALLAEVRRLQAQLAERDRECETQYELLAEKNQQLTASQRRERAAVEDMLKVLLSQLEKEKAIISNEHGKDYAHLNFADGRRHTLMRVEAWAKTQIKEWRGPDGEGV